ncbi:hypothetical protein CQ048_17460 [Pseudomonas trivialis]|nr:hypothetical protein CQ048_17460 [Pseudomonas trivialis]PRB25154.1 hypothetical protein CQ041_17200 [Pseudomonas sp. MYb60]
MQYRLWPDCKPFICKGGQMPFSNFHSGIEAQCTFLFSSKCFFICKFFCVKKVVQDCEPPRLLDVRRGRDLFPKILSELVRSFGGDLTINSGSTRWFGAEQRC